MKCIFGCEHAVAVYIMPRGCVCKREIVQALCAQHEYKRRPLSESFLVTRFDVFGLTKMIPERPAASGINREPQPWWVTP